MTNTDAINQRPVEPQTDADADADTDVAVAVNVGCGNVEHHVQSPRHPIF